MILPLFPLKLVAFPTEKLNLHIFEARYKEMIKDCLKEGRTFGILPYLNDKMATYGTEIRILEVAKRYDNGEMDIKTEGLRVFKVEEFHKVTPNKQYSTGVVSWQKNQLEGDVLTNLQLIELIDELHQALNVKKKFERNHELFSTYDIAHYVGFTPDQEYHFLCILTEKERQLFMLNHLHKLLPIVKEMARLRERALLNGHFKNIIPPKV